MQERETNRKFQREMIDSTTISESEVMKGRGRSSWRARRKKGGETGISKSGKSVSLVRTLKPAKYKEIQEYEVEPVGRLQNNQVDRTLEYDEIEV